MHAKFINGVYEVDNDVFILRLDKSHRILNAEELNEQFHVKIPTTSYFTVERLLQHKQIQENKPLRKYLEKVVDSISEETKPKIEKVSDSISEEIKPKIVMYDGFTPISSFITTQSKTSEVLDPLKTILKIVKILIVIWVVIMVMEIIQIQRPGTTLNIDDKPRGVVF